MCPLFQPTLCCDYKPPVEIDQCIEGVMELVGNRRVLVEEHRAEEEEA